MSIACKTPDSASREPLPDDATLACASAPDALTAIASWIVLDPGEQVMSDPARALREQWSTLYVARAWRVDGAHWMALISDSAEPAPDQKALLLSVTRSSDGAWTIDSPAQVTRADVLWPQL